MGPILKDYTVNSIGTYTQYLVITYKWRRMSKRKREGVCVHIN